MSVIIPTFNRCALLEKALGALVRQTLDNGSTDATHAVAHSFKGILKNIRYCQELQPGLHAGPHRGVVEAGSDLLVYADDDIKSFPTLAAGRSGIRRP